MISTLELSTIATTLAALIIDSTAKETDTLVSNYTEGTRTKSQSKDNINCPDQSHWIFIGVLVGLAIGLLLLWLFNCFHVANTVTETPSDE